MSTGSKPERLLFLAETVMAEARHLAATDARLFSEPMAQARAADLRMDLDLSERADAELAAALNAAHRAVPLLAAAAAAMVERIHRA